MNEADSNEARPSTGSPAPPRARHRHRRWPWVLGALGAVLAAFAIFVVVTWDPARPVSMGQAEQRLGSEGQGVAGARPARGVYLYTGTGTDTLSLPPLSQAEGPTMPGTVTLQGHDCWTFRVDYSSHHWETWNFCRQGNDTMERGGLIWQLWAIGPLHETNLTTLTCTSDTMWLPASATPGQNWHSDCRGTSSAVKGVMHSIGPYRFVGTTTLDVGGHPVRVGRVPPIPHRVGSPARDRARRDVDRRVEWPAATDLPGHRCRHRHTVRLVDLHAAGHLHAAVTGRSRLKHARSAWEGESVPHGKT